MANKQITALITNGNKACFISEVFVFKRYFSSYETSPSKKILSIPFTSSIYLKYKKTPRSFQDNIFFSTRSLFLKHLVLFSEDYYFT